MLTGKTAIVTGGGKGIGREISLHLAKSGADIAIIFAGDESAAAESKKSVLDLGRKCEIYKCDVSDFDAVKGTIGMILAEFNKVDILVNNAGITKDKLVLSMTEGDYDSVLDINLKGAFNMIKHLYSHFMRSRAGRIINITSISGLDGNAGQANYSASKAGLVGLTKSVAKELAARNVTCNAVAPGFIETAMTEVLNEQFKAQIVDRIPLKKMGSAADVAALVSFLASDSAAYITGQVIRVDGGLCI